jgi:hypothetical protein
MSKLFMQANPDTCQCARCGRDVSQCQCDAGLLLDTPSQIVFAVAAWRTDPQAILNEIRDEIETLLDGRMTDCFVYAHVSDPPKEEPDGH